MRGCEGARVRGCESDGNAGVVTRRYGWDEYRE